MQNPTLALRLQVQDVRVRIDLEVAECAEALHNYYLYSLLSFAGCFPLFAFRSSEETMADNAIEIYGLRASQARREGRLIDAISNAKEAIALARKYDDDMKLVRALMLLGQVERDRARHSDAFVHYREAVNLSRTVDPPTRFAHVLRHLGDLYSDRGEFNEAETCYAEALDIYRTSEETTPGDLANVIRSYAVLKDAAGSVIEARNLWVEARLLYLSLGIQEGVDECDARIIR